MYGYERSREWRHVWHVSLWDERGRRVSTFHIAESASDPGWYAFDTARSLSGPWGPHVGQCGTAGECIAELERWKAEGLDFYGLCDALIGKFDELKEARHG